MVVLSIFIALFINSSVWAASYTVTSTADSGPGTLRQAITDANTSPGADQIDFAIVGAGQQTITLASALPFVTDTTTINGLSQPGSVCDGANSVVNIYIDINEQVNAFVLQPGAAGSEINGLALGNTPDNTYALYVGSDSTTVRCNFFGTTDGYTSLASGIATDWLVVYGDDATIGGSSTTDANVFLGQSNGGVFLAGGSTQTVSNNLIGVAIDGLTDVDSVSRGIGISTPLSAVYITNNIIHANDGGVYFDAGANTSSNILIQSNHIGVGFDGLVAYSGVGPGLVMNGSYSNVQIDSNVIYADTDHAISMGGDNDDVTITNNMINVDEDGQNKFTNSAGTGIVGGSGSSNWLIDANVIYSATSYGITLTAASDIVITANEIGYPVDRASCFAGQYAGINVGGSQDVQIGGIGVGDGNAICVAAENNGIAADGLLANDVSILGNIIDSQGKAIALQPTGVLPAPILRSASEGSGSTIVTFDATIPVAGSYRFELFENDSIVNGASYPQAQELIGVQSITINVTGAGRYSVSIPGTGFGYLAATLTLVDESADGFGETSELGILQPETDLQITTTDDAAEVFEGATGHQITQTITNIGDSSVTDFTFDDDGTDCVTVNSVTVSGSATDPGSYSHPAWTGQLDAGQTLVLTFDVDITCLAGNNMNLTSAIADIKSNGYDVSDTTPENNSYTDTSNIVTPQVDLTVTTTDNTEEILEYSTGHEIIQTIQNNGAVTVTSLEFEEPATNCFSLAGITTGGTATDVGSYAANVWTGVLTPGQQLTLIYSGDVSCDAGNSLDLTTVLSQISSDSLVLVDSSAGDDYGESTSIIGPVTDISVSKVLINPEDYATGATLQYEITVTNNGPQPLDLTQFDGSGPNPFESNLFLDVMPADLTFVDGSSTNSDILCAFLAPAGVAGGLLENHSDANIISCSYLGAATLSSGDSISTAISATVGEESDLQFTNHAISGWPASDPDLAVMLSPFGVEGACQSDSDIIDCYSSEGVNNYAASAPVSDIAISKQLVGNGNILSEQTVDYTIALTNTGPMPFNMYTDPADRPLFADLFPAQDLTFQSVATSDLACTDLGPGSNAYLGQFASDHTQHQLLVCSYSGEQATLAVGETRRFTLRFTAQHNIVLDSTNYAFTTASITDLDSLLLLDTIAGTESDILDHFTSDNTSKVTYRYSTDSKSSPSDSNDLASTGQKQLDTLFAGGVLLALGVALGTYAYRNKLNKIIS